MGGKSKDLDLSPHPSRTFSVLSPMGRLILPLTVVALLVSLSVSCQKEVLPGWEEYDEDNITRSPNDTTAGDSATLHIRFVVDTTTIKPDTVSFNF